MRGATPLAGSLRSVNVKLWFTSPQQEQRSSSDRSELTQHA